MSLSKQDLAPGSRSQMTKRKTWSRPSRITTLAEDLFKGKQSGERGAFSRFVSPGHREPVHEFATVSAVVYPTSRPQERKHLLPTDGADYTSVLIGRKARSDE
jgi:hypothetical protein